jgi:hypothetical protein
MARWQAFLGTDGQFSTQSSMAKKEDASYEMCHTDETAHKTCQR